MRTPRTLAVTALTAATIALSAGPALAAPPGGIEASPTPVAPGSTVSLTTTACGKNATAVVTVFDVAPRGRKVRLTSKGQTFAENVQGSFRIPKKAKKGPHGITGRCSDGTRLTGVIVVGSAD
jgi:hypothetical protein